MKGLKALKHKPSSGSLARPDLTNEAGASSTNVQRVSIRALPSGGRTRGPRRFVSADSLASTGTERSTISSRRTTFTHGHSFSSSSGDAVSIQTGSSGSSSGASRPPSYEVATGPPRRHSHNSSLQSREILRQGQTYSPLNRTAAGHTDQAHVSMQPEASTNYRGSAIEHTEQSLVHSARFGVSSGQDRRFISTYQGFYSTTPATSTESPPAEERAIVPLPFRLESANPREELQLERFNPASGTQSETRFNRRQLTETPHDENSPVIRARISSLTPARRLQPLPAIQEQRMIHRPIALSPALRAVARLPPTASTSFGNIVRNQQLLLPAAPDEQDAWTEDEGDDDGDSSSEAGSDFGCIGLTKWQYEEMLAMGKGYPCRQILVEGVDAWPEVVRVDGYKRVWQWRGDEEY